MVDIKIIRNGITSLPQDVQDEILKLVEKEEAVQTEIAEKEKQKAEETILVRKTDTVAQVAAVIESFDPKILFAAGAHDGTRLWHGDNFKKHLFNPAKSVGNVAAQNFQGYENKQSAYDKQIRAEIGEQVITPDQLWAAWKDLIFKQPKGQAGTLKTNGYANVWYVQCYDGIVRTVFCHWDAGYGEWSLYCNELDDVYWGDGQQFFVGDDAVQL